MTPNGKLWAMVINIYIRPCECFEGNQSYLLNRGPAVLDAIASLVMLISAHLLTATKLGR